MNSLLLSLTALLILVLSALFAAPLFVDWNDYRPVFETQASKLLGREVKVGGEVNLVLLPAPELRFDDVKVADEAGRLDRPFLEARSIEAWLNIGALLSGAIEARKIAIVDPVLRLDLGSDGTGNWSDVGRPGVGLPLAPKDVMLDSVSVSGGTVELTKEGRERLTLTALDGELSAASLAGPYKVQAAYDFAGRRQDLRFSTSAPDLQGLFRLKAALRDTERNTTYLVDGNVTGLGAKPDFDGSFVMRVANAAPAEPAASDANAAPSVQDEQQPAGPDKPLDAASFFELKGPLTATPERAELLDFDLIIHAKGRPQILKGNLTLDLGEPLKAAAQLAARFVDLDTFFSAPGAEQRPSPAAVLYLFAEEALREAAGIGQGSLAVTVEQASLGGDLVSGLDLAFTAREGVMTIEHLRATLPGDNRIDAAGRVSQGAVGPLFAGPIVLKGSGLTTLSRWAAGDRDMSGQTSIGAFAIQADATIGDGELSLANVTGELSETSFRGHLLYRAGTRNLMEISLDSDRLDLREMIGDGAVLRSFWAQSSASGDAENGEPNLLARLRDDDVRVTLNVEELLLPHIPAGKLDAHFALVDDTLNVERLDFRAADEIALDGEGSIERLSEAPSGRVDFALRATTTDSLRITSKLFGLPEGVAKSKHLSALAPLDVRVGLVAGREGDVTRASLELGGQAAGSDIALVASARGHPGKLAEAEIDIGGSVTGDRPQALLVLLFPNLPQERFAAAGGSQGTLSVKLKGVPRTKVVGKAGLETGAMQISFEGQGAVPEAGTVLAGNLSVVTKDASLALMLAGLEAPPSAAGVPLELRADLVKQGQSVDLKSIKAIVDGNEVEGSAHFGLGEDKTGFSLSASADTLSLPSLLGSLVAWQRSPSTEEMLGAIGAGASEVWPSRGFSMGVIEKSRGDITLTAKTLSLGAPFQVSDATLIARVDKDGLAVTDLRGVLFGGAFAASGTLSPRGTGAELEAHAQVKGGKLENLSRSLAGKNLAKGPFDLSFAVQGEGLSPPGLVAGLTGEGTLSLGAGAVQALSPDALHRAAAAAAKKTIKADKEKIAAEARTVGEKVTTGVYRYAPVKFAFDVKNGTLRLMPATLAGTGAETKVNAYVELASLKLDSEWVMSLAGQRNKNVPPVSLVFAGSLSEAAKITPSVDTAAIETYLTMRRMQEDVERLETLDVTGRTPLPDERTPLDDVPMHGEAAADAETPIEAPPLAPPAARADTLPWGAPQSSPPAELVAPSTEAMQIPVPNAGPAEAAEPAAMQMPVPNAQPDGAAEPAAMQMPVLNAEPDEAAQREATPAALSEAPPAETAEPEAPAAAPAQLPEEVPVETIEPSEAASFEEDPTAEAAPAPPESEQSARPRRTSPAASRHRREPRDAWKKGIGIFGGY